MVLGSCASLGETPEQLAKTLGKAQAIDEAVPEIRNESCLGGAPQATSDPALMGEKAKELQQVNPKRPKNSVTWASQIVVSPRGTAITSHMDHPVIKPIGHVFAGQMNHPLFE